MPSIPDPVPHASIHHTFSIREIQYHIFEYLRDGFGTEGFRSLARLARTSTLFKEAALDILWRELVTIVPFIKVMPEDLWSVVSSREDDYETHTIQFTRSLEPTDWDRFDYYAPRILSLGLPYTPLFQYFQYGFNSIQIHESVLEGFCAYRPVHPLFKNLRTLCAKLQTAYTTRFFAFLLNPSIVSLFIMVYDTILLAEELPRLLFLIPHHCPNIQGFTPFFLNVPLPQSVSALERLTVSLSHLRKLFVTVPFSADVLHQIGNLPELRELLVQLSSEGSTQEARDIFVSTDDRFSELRVFHLRAHRLGHVTQAMSSLQRPLTELYIEVKESDDTNTFSTFETFARVFLRHPCASSLVKLHLHVTIVGFEDGDVASAFRPLLAVYNMSAFRVVSQCVLELDNAFIADAAKAWPRLKNLTLLPSPLPEASTRPKMTLSGLIPLIRHCPDLNFLQVSIVADPFEPSLLLPKMFNM
ncbi:hypothetical protein E4T56_gene9253, partial [Termitomyces sp. T112]